jgi:hypothetical protein
VTPFRSSRALPTALLVALCLLPEVADAWQLRLDRQYVPFPPADLRTGLAVDLDGDGREEYVGLAVPPFYSRPVAHVLRHDGATGKPVHAGGVPLPSYLTNGRLLPFRIPGTSRHGLVASPDFPWSGSPAIMLEGPKLSRRTTLPIYDTETVIAAGDADGDGVIDIFTARGTTIHRWSPTDGAVPLATGTFSGCSPQLFARCLRAELAQVDGDPELELIAAGAQTDVLDAASLALEAHSSFGPTSELELAEIDGDAASEWVQLRPIDQNVDYIAGVFNGSAQPARELPCEICINGRFAIGDTFGADGRDELLYGHANAQTYRVDLQTGVRTFFGAPLEVRTAVDFDGDGIDELVTYFELSGGLLRVWSASALPSTIAQFVPEVMAPIRRWNPGRLVLPRSESISGQFRIAEWPGGQTIHTYPETLDWQVLRPIYDVAFAAADTDGVEDLVLLTDTAVHGFSGLDYHELWRIEPQMVPSRRYPYRLAPLQLDADPQMELIAAVDRGLEAWDVPSGAVLWSIPVSMLSHAVLEIAQLDTDPGLEAVVSTRHQFHVFDLDSRTLQYTVAGEPGAALAVNTYQGSPHIYANSNGHLVVRDPIDGAEVARFEDLPLLYGLAVVPGTRLMIGLAWDRAIAFDADTGAVVATSAFLDSSLQAERNPVVRALGNGRFSVEVPGTTTYSELTLDPSLFSDGFEPVDE